MGRKTFELGLRGLGVRQGSLSLEKMSGRCSVQSSLCALAWWYESLRLKERSDGVCV